MVIDTFLFFNELDLLEIRLNILDQYVDKFVLVEARQTFMGKDKPLYYAENKERFAKWNDKIVHYVIEDLSEEELASARLSPNVGAGEHYWVREFAQKECILKALTFANDSDIVFVSDLDEIWNPEIFNKVPVSELNPDIICSPVQTAYHYYLNNRSDQSTNGWVGTRLGTIQRLRELGVNHFRNRENTSLEIPNGGWHFTFQGGKEAIEAKIEAYSHQEYNTLNIKSRIKYSLFANEDFALRGFKLWKDESQLPKYLIENKQKWIHLFK
jgi:beta-1,4-mannosyl-glycoprotein beta-1,4-N-acetylglucosaminyltransferase